MQTLKIQTSLRIFAIRHGDWLSGGYEIYGHLPDGMVMDGKVFT